MSVFNDIDSGSTVYKTSSNLFNTATVKNSDNPTTPNPIAIAGAQTQVGSLEDSSFKNVAYAFSSRATNKGTGDAVSGVENALGTVDGSYASLTNRAKGSFSKTKDGDATSGTETGINEITDSTINIDSSAVTTSSTSRGGNAVSGV